MQERERINLQLRFLSGLNFSAPFSRDGRSTNRYVQFSAKTSGLSAALVEVPKQILTEESAIQSTTLKITETQSKIDLLLNQMNQYKVKSGSGNSQKWEKSIYVLVTSQGQATDQVRATYMISGAQWIPAYDVRVELDRKSNQARIKLVYAGNVEQSTGQDWLNVKLKLSSLDPTPLYLPQLRKWSFAEVREEARSNSFAGGGRKLRKSKSMKESKKRMSAPEMMDDPLAESEMDMDDSEEVYADEAFDEEESEELPLASVAARKPKKSELDQRER